MICQTVGAKSYTCNPCTQRGQTLKIPYKAQSIFSKLCISANFENSKMLEIDNETAGDLCSNKAQGSDRVQGRNSVSSRNLCKLLQTVRSEESRVKAVVLRIVSPGMSRPPPSPSLGGALLLSPSIPHEKAVSGLTHQGQVSS